jgi:phosphocarrier protein HPr
VVVEREIEVVNRLGLHARAAAKLVHLTGGFKSGIQLVSDEEEVDAKSILGILLLAAGQGSRLVLRCDGEDEAEALAAVSDLFAQRFGEGE